MLDKQKYIISDSATVKDALKILNNISEALTLFVVNKMNIMIGTITDGDIRRHLIEGITLEHPVTSAMNPNFYFIKENEINVQFIKELKRKEIHLLPLLNKKGEIINIYNLKKRKSVVPIDAVLMAGGKGERLRPLTEKTPKPLIKIGNKSIIDYNIDRLIDYGINHINVTVNYLKEQIISHFSSPRNGINIKCISEPDYLGTIGSVKFIESFHNDVILVMNSDLFTNIDYEDFYLHFKENEADIAVAAIPYSYYIPYGIFDLEGDNIKGTLEKPTYNYYANAGIYLIKRELLDLIPENQFFDAPDLLQLLINRRNKVIKYPLTGYWIDIGKHEDYNKAQELIKHINF